MKIRIGTRGSKLALWQAYYVRDRREAEGIETEVIPIETKGDKILDVSISKIGSKGVFTEEIEEQLALGGIDIAVHSAKDMPSDLPKGFELIAFGEREDVNDVIVSNNNVDLTKNNLVVGTSSTRRIAFLKKYYPHIKTVPVRGNLQTRLKKMEEGLCDALLLAYAGIHRMGYGDQVKLKMPYQQFTPAVGQGSITIEASNKLDEPKREAIRKCINDESAEIAIRTERSFLKKMQGGCSVPIFGYAEIFNDKVEIQGGIISLDGSKFISTSMEGNLNEYEQIGEHLGDYILENGGSEILKEIKKEQSID